MNLNIIIIIIITFLVLGIRNDFILFFCLHFFYLFHTN